MELTTIHSDNRGSISALVGDLTTVPEVTIFKTKAGYARGGCIHEKSGEALCVIEGMIKYVWGNDKEEITMTPGRAIVIEPNTPHYYLSVTDSIVMEWGPTLEEKKGKHLEFRAIVDEINKKKDAQ